MHQAQIGDRVRVQYFRIPEHVVATDKRSRAKTCEFTVGGREVFPTLSLGVLGMMPGDRKQLTLQPPAARRTVQPKLVQEIPRARFPEHLMLQVGKRLTAVNATS